MDLTGEAGCGFSSCRCYSMFHCVPMFPAVCRKSLREVGRLAIRKASAGREACAAGFVGHCTADFGMPSPLRGGWRR